MTGVSHATLTDHERRVLERFVALLQRDLGDRLVAAWLYGSRARGEHVDPESDVDVLVLTRSGAVDRPTVTRLASEAALSEGSPFVLISTQTAAPAWVEERRAIDDFFIQEIDRDKIPLLGER